MDTTIGLGVDEPRRFGLMSTIETTKRSGIFPGCHEWYYCCSYLILHSGTGFHSISNELCWDGLLSHTFYTLHTLRGLSFVANWSGLIPLELYCSRNLSWCHLISLLRIHFRYFSAVLFNSGFTFGLDLLLDSRLDEFCSSNLSFRLFGNILADELTLGVLSTLVPLLVPVPVMLLGLFTSGIQALVFSTLTGAYCGEAIEAALQVKAKWIPGNPG
jgi:hypothetical protein